MIVKRYGMDRTKTEARRSPAICQSIKRTAITGNPGMERV
jgi:hypothetical protein